MNNKMEKVAISICFNSIKTWKFIQYKICMILHLGSFHCKSTEKSKIENN